MKRYRTIGLMVLFAAIGAGMLFPPSVSAGDSFGIVVVVNGTPITKYDLQSHMDRMVKNFKARQGSRANEAELVRAVEEQRSQIVQNMIDEQLMNEEIARLNLTVDPKQVDAYLDKVKKDAGADEIAFEAQMQDMGITLEEFREKVETDMLKQRLVSGMVGAKLVITDADIESEFEKNPEVQGGLRYHLRAIIVPTAEEMETVVDAVRGGSMTFAEAAQAYSVGPVPEEGGDIGSIALHAMASDWQQALQDVEPGELAEPFESNGQHVLLELVETSKLNVDDFPGMRDKLFNQIRERRMGVLFDEYMDRLREMAIIEWK